MSHLRLIVVPVEAAIPVFIGKLVSLMEASDRHAALARQSTMLLAMVLMMSSDWRLGMPTLLWFAGYVAFLRHFVPRMRDLAKASAEVRSLVMARIVDSYSNMLTVKLFARLADEDAYAREAIDEHQTAIGAHMQLISQFMFWLSALNAALLTVTAAAGIWLWAEGAVGAGVVAMVLPLSWQIANAAGWVSWEVAGIFENIGVVQEGMQTIAVPHTGIDPPAARKLDVSRGELLRLGGHYERLWRHQSGGFVLPDVVATETATVTAAELREELPQDEIPIEAI